MSLPELPDGYQWRQDGRGTLYSRPKAQCGRCGEYDLRAVYRQPLLLKNTLTVACGNCGVEADLSDLTDD